LHVNRLTLRLFGGFHAHLGAGTPLPLTARKAQALLAYLAVRPGQAHPRDKLATLLWPDTSDDQARQSLRVALVALRRALSSAEPAILMAEGETLGLAAPAVDVDVVAFERRLAEGTPEALAEAARLYQGDLLEGFRIAEAPFEEWLTAERARLYELAVEGLGKLLQHQLAAGPVPVAVQTALRLVALDPLQEPVHRALMRLHVAQGRRGAALKQYQVCVAVLRRELGADPEIETRRLYQEIVRRPSPIEARRSDQAERHASGPSSGAPSRSALPGEETPLVGRETELEQLRTLLEASVEGRGHLVVITGEAGIGKTRLLSALATEAVKRQCRVLIGRCHESDSILPFGPWVEACRSSGLSTDDEVLCRLTPDRRAELSRLLPEVNAPGLPRPGDSDLRLFEGVTQLMEEAASREPVLLMLEDLHWADEMSLRLLAFVSRRVQPWPALVVATARVEDLADAAIARHTIGEVCRARQAVRLELSPLSVADTHRLVQALARDRESTANLEERVWAVSEGNPFVVVETTRAIQDGSCSLGPRSPLPQQVRELIARRLERLSHCARTLAEVAAVIGREVDFALLHKASGLDEHDTAEGVEELVRRNVLREVGERFGFSHERIRAVVHDQLLPPQCKLRHRRVAEALETLHVGNPEQFCQTLGTHFREAEVWDKALKYLRQAGADAQARSANREAAALFGQALAALQQLPESPETLSEELDIRIALGPCLAAVHGPGSSEFEASYVAAQELCRRLDARPRLFPALWGLWNVSFNRGHHREARDLAERLLSLAQELEDPVLLLEARHSLWPTLFGSGDLEAAELVIRQARAQYNPQRHREYASSYGGHDTGICCLTFASITAWTRGYPDRALRYSEEALKLAGQLNHPLSTALAHYYAAWVHYQRGEAAKACENAVIARDTGASVQTGRRAMLLARLGLRAPLEASELDELRQNIRSPWWQWLHTFASCLLAEAHVRAGRPDQGLAVLAEIPQHALDTVYSSEIYRCRGQLLLSRGHANAPEAEDCFRTAVELAHRGGRRSLELRAATSLSRLLQQQGKHEDARHMLAEIHSWFTEGFDTADIRDATTLLEELSRAST
jgi:DNA-binding SARP family transcriptional activator/tetratricopeptide (TPR) repeat protein